MWHVQRKCRWVGACGECCATQKLPERIARGGEHPPFSCGTGVGSGHRKETSCSDGTERRPSKAPRGQACGMRDVSRCVCAHADQRPPIAHAQFLHDVQNDHPPRGCGEASGLGAGGGVVRDVVALRRGDASVRKQGSPHNRPRADATFGHLWFATRVVR